MIGKTLKSGLALSLLCASVAVPAAVVYDESVDGDLSGSPAAPTLIVLGLGDNEITGEVGDTALALDFSDSFELDLGGLELISIEVLAIEIDTGSTVRFSNCSPGATVCNFSADENAGVSFTESDLGGDLLAELVAVPPALGFITEFFQMTESEGPSRYRLNFITDVAVSAPAPAPFMLLAAGVLAFGVGARRKA